MGGLIGLVGSTDHSVALWEIAYTLKNAGLF